jgi:hypothetical protein
VESARRVNPMGRYCVRGRTVVPADTWAMPLCRYPIAGGA